MDNDEKNLKIECETDEASASSDAKTEECAETEKVGDIAQEDVAVKEGEESETATESTDGSDNGNESEVSESTNGNNIEKPDDNDKNVEYAQNIYDVIKNDDIESFEKLAAADPKFLTYKLGVLPLAAVAVLTGADKITERLTEEYYSTNKFKGLPAPLDLIVKMSGLFAHENEMYKSASTIEPSEVYLLKGNLKKFDAFVKVGGIKTVSSRRRSEELVAKLDKSAVISAGSKKDLYKIVKPQDKKKIVLTVLIVFAVLVVISIPTIVMACLRTTVTFYDGGVELGTQTGFAGGTITFDKPEKEHYVFTGWYSDPECTDRIDELSKKHTELYAGWTIQKFKISFDYDGEQLEPMVGSYIDSYSLPVLTAQGKLFLGWYDGDERVVNGVYSKSMTLKAEFKDITIEDGVFTVTDSDEFMYLNTISATKFVLGDDITLKDDFLSCGFGDDYYDHEYVGFDAVFDGNGKTITYGASVYPLFVMLGENASVGDLNIVCTQAMPQSYSIDRFGLVAALNKGVIKNVTINAGAEDATVDGNKVDNSLHLYAASSSVKFIGILAGGNNGTISDCVVNGNVRCAVPSMSTNTLYFGAISGTNVGKINNCTNKATVVSTSNCGGICGVSQGEVYSCLNEGSLTLSNGLSSSNINVFLGGVIGNANSTSKTSDCINNGDIMMYVEGLNSYQGGIAGVALADIERCVNNGKIFVWVNKYFYYAGGIAGYVTVNDSDVTIADCVNKGEVDANNNYYGFLGGIAGGFVGKEDGVQKVVRCINEGEVKDGLYVAGLGGRCGEFEFSECRNVGDVTAASRYSDNSAVAGGLICQALSCVIDSCVNKGKVTADGTKIGTEENFQMSPEEYAKQFTNFAGGLVGVLNSSTLKNSYSTATLSGLLEDQKGYYGVFAGLASTGDDDTEIINCYALALSDYGLGWTEYSAAVDENGNYVNADENGQPVYQGVDAVGTFETVQEMYTLAATLGDKFKDVDEDTPRFVWEE